MVRRVAFFSDSFHEVNGVALTSREFESFARQRQLPFFCVRASKSPRIEQTGQLIAYELQRSPAAFSLEGAEGLCFDLFLWRHRRTLLKELRTFRPDLVHVTGPGDVGMLGASLAHELRVPLVASWHTNVHEYAGRRLEKLLSLLPRGPIEKLSHATEEGALMGTAKFYSMARLLFAPNQELIDMLRKRTGKPCFLMQRGVDSELYSPSKRTIGDRPFTIGYVGRLNVEKNVRLLPEIEKTLIAAGHTNYRFVIVGLGMEEAWLRQNMRRAEFPGVLRGKALATAYANMDVFAFPSFTDTFGNVIVEALASGVPSVVTTGGGPKFLVKSGETGFVSADEASFIRCILQLMTDREMHARMREAARCYACGISWDRVFEQVYEAYETVLFPAASSHCAAS